MDYFDILLAKKLSGGGGGEIVLEDITITENGVVTAPSGKAYKKITTDVPLPDNAYLLKEIEGLPKDIATFTDGSALPLASLKTTIVPIQSGSGDPSPSNVRPISGWTEAEVSVCGVNIWDEEWEIGAINNTTGQNSYGPSTIRSKNYISVKPSTTYFYCNLSNKYIAIYYYDDNKAYIRYYDREDNRTFTTPDNCYYIRFVINASYGTTYNNDISINYPSTDTSYHAYNGHTTTIPFTDAQGNPIEVFGGEVDCVNGTSGNKKTLGSVDMGDLNWTLENGIFRLNESIGAKLTSDTSAVANMMCSHYKTVSQNAMGSTTTDQCVAGLNWSNGVRVKDSNYTDVASFKQAMSGVQLVYELANPTTFESLATPVKSLSGSNNVWGDCGDITELSYFSKPSEE